MRNIILNNQDQRFYMVISKGTGDNLLKEDVENGYATYANWNCYNNLLDATDEVNETDSGMVLLEKAINQYSKEELIQKVIEDEGSYNVEDFVEVDVETPLNKLLIAYNSYQQNAFNEDSDELAYELPEVLPLVFSSFETDDGEEISFQLSYDISTKKLLIWFDPGDGDLTSIKPDYEEDYDIETCIDDLNTGSDEGYYSFVHDKYRELHGEE